MRSFRRATLAALTCLTLVGGSAIAAGAARPAATPEAKTSVKATWKKLEKAIKRGGCERLAPYVVHTSARPLRGTPPKPATLDTPLSDQECENAESFAEAIEEFELTKFEEFGTGAVGEGTAPDITTPNKAVVVFLLDQDRRWKAYYAGEFDPQVGTEPSESVDWAATANGFVEAFRAGDCDALWRYFLADSSYVTTRENTGGVDKLCTDIETAVATGQGRTYDLRQSTEELEDLGGTQDIGFWGLELENGRYLTFLLFTSNEAADVIGRHADPGVYEFVTTRPPDDQ